MNKYKRWYDNIIKIAQNRPVNEYTEVHHIIPRSLGGIDDANNLVELTAREHFICHILLTKFTQGRDRRKMISAAMLMKAENSKQERYMNSRLYEILRKEYALIRSKEQCGELNHFYGKTHTTDSRQKMSESKKKMYSNGKHPHIGMKRSDESKHNISQSVQGFRHWTDGVNNIKSKECPGPEWKIGRAPNQNFKWSEEKRLKIKNEYSNGKMNWWTNGNTNIRSKECPGLEWKRGRTMSTSLYSKFCKKSSN